MHAKSMNVVLLVCTENGGDVDSCLLEAEAPRAESKTFGSFITRILKVACPELAIADLGKNSLEKLPGLLEVVDKCCTYFPQGFARYSGLVWHSSFNRSFIESHDNIGCPVLIRQPHHQSRQHFPKTKSLIPPG